MKKNNWEYGEVYKKYDMSGIIEVGGGKLKVHDIFEPLPEFMKEADCIFCDPPCSLGNINSFYTKADRVDYQQSYMPFAMRFFECIDEIKPKILFIEVFKSNYDLFLEELQSRYKYIAVINSTYYHNKKNKCWVILATNEPILHIIDNFNGLDEETIIEKICESVPFTCIGDLCMGRGLVGWNAYKNGKNFVGTELNPKRLAILVDKILNS